MLDKVEKGKRADRAAVPRCLSEINALFTGRNSSNKNDAPLRVSDEPSTTVIKLGSAQIDLQQSVMEDPYPVGKRNDANRSEALRKDVRREGRLQSCSMAFGSPPRFRLTARGKLLYIPTNSLR